MTKKHYKELGLTEEQAVKQEKFLSELFAGNFIDAMMYAKDDPALLNTPYNKNGFTPFHWIVKEYFESVIVREFLALGADVNIATASSGETALHIACRRRSSPEVIQLLIDHGADINRQDAYGYTGLMRVLEHPQVQMRKSVIQCLLDNNADVQNLRSIAGNTAAEMMLKLI